MLKFVTRTANTAVIEGKLVDLVKGKTLLLLPAKEGKRRVVVIEDKNGTSCQIVVSAELSEELNSGKIGVEHLLTCEVSTRETDGAEWYLLQRPATEGNVTRLNGDKLASVAKQYKREVKPMKLSAEVLKALEEAI